MILLGITLNVFVLGIVLAGTSMDCLEAEHRCMQEQECMLLYRVLEYCVAEEAVAPLGAEGRRECLDAQVSLQRYRPLQACKCQRGSRKEEHCLRAYWTIRFAAYEEYDVSPYVEMKLMKNIMMSRMASIMAASSSLQLDGQNHCLKAAQDCGLFEKCGSLRSEYVVACTKHTPGTDAGTCNRQRCHRALRRFLERVPEDYVFALLFCPCSDALCGERRRKTIVPFCSYEERSSKPNCLSLQAYCTQDDLCRSRLADFQHNCQPSSQSPSGCTRERGAICLKAYAGLIGTIMTPNYVSNSSWEMALWCSCEGSGNQLHDCQRILDMFSSNTCLRNAISSFGGLSTSPVRSSSQPPPQPSHHIQQATDKVVLDISPDRITEQQSEGEKGGQELNVISPFSAKGGRMTADVRSGHKSAAHLVSASLPVLAAALWLWWSQG